MRIGFYSDDIVSSLNNIKECWSEKILNFSPDGAEEYEFVIECDPLNTINVLKHLPKTTSFVLASDGCDLVLVSKNGNFSSPDFYDSLTLKAGLYNDVGLTSPEDGSIITEDDLDQIHQMEGEYGVEN